MGYVTHERIARYVPKVDYLCNKKGYPYR